MTRLRASEETRSAAEQSHRPAPSAVTPSERGDGALNGPLTAERLAQLQASAGNRAVVHLFPAAPTVVARQAASVLGGLADVLRRLSVEERAAEFDRQGRNREATALRNMLAYATMHWSAGPLGDDPGFGLRLYLVALQLSGEFGDSASFVDLPARLKAIIFSAEKLNLDPLGSGTVAARNQEWMKTTGGTVGGTSPKAPGSTGAFGPNAWKCNKLVADAYLARGGADIGKGNYPFYGEGRDRQWAYQANDLAADVRGGDAQADPRQGAQAIPLHGVGAPVG